MCKNLPSNVAKVGSKNHETFIFVLLSKNEWRKTVAKIVQQSWIVMIQLQLKNFDNYSVILGIGKPVCTPVLVSYMASVQNKSPLTWWLKATEIYAVTVLETRSQNYETVETPYKASRKSLSLSPLASGLLAFFGLWQHNFAFVFMWPSSVSLCVQISFTFLLKDTCLWI